MLEKLRAFYTAKKDITLCWLIVIAIGYSAIRYFNEYKLVAVELFIYFAIAGVIYLTNEWTRDVASTTKSSGPVFYAKVIFWCIAAALVVKYSLGSHLEDTDPMFGNGTRVIDYMPTHIQQAKSFWRVFILLWLSATNGAMNGLPRKQYRIIRDRLQSEQKETR